MKTEPQYEHDCDQCVFIGALTLPEGTSFDIYTCENGPGPTTVVRFSDNGADYMSGSVVNFYQLGFGLYRLNADAVEELTEVARRVNLTTNEDPGEGYVGNQRRAALRQLAEEEGIEITEEPWHGIPWPDGVPYGPSNID